ncbi:MAG: bifunctional (p)ppGpp synthetase/guanosine-3',5'-bis(diphosphate) 3'-pyrophosphohydrolase, partial [Chloroflexi bacterium]|nr:bifunctional (p)ppGpp synthetase/guanosine-3',5'-bis(diphosphate) 3'-pyrophosphohydrolase [Chloroflexota bacterium]
MSATSLLFKAKSYLPADRYRFVESALEFASLCHQGQVRKSGEAYIEHPIATAEFLVSMRVDATTLAAAVLHDVMEDSGVEFETLESKFGHEVAVLVDGVTTLRRMTLLGQPEADSEQDSRPATGDPRAAVRAASTRKMLVAMAKDVRVILIKLADRLHNLRTLQA